MDLSLPVSMAGSIAPAQGRSRHAADSDHCPHRPRHGGGQGESVPGRVQRLRDQTRRSAPPAHQDSRPAGEVGRTARTMPRRAPPSAAGRSPGAGRVLVPDGRRTAHHPRGGRQPAQPRHALGRLESEGCRVVFAPNGREALGWLDRQACDLVLLEMMTPEMDGLEVLGSIRSSYSLVELPVILVTANDHSEDMVAALQLARRLSRQALPVSCSACPDANPVADQRGAGPAASRIDCESRMPLERPPARRMPRARCPSPSQEETAASPRKPPCPRPVSVRPSSSIRARFPEAGRAVPAAGISTIGPFARAAH